MSEKYTALYLLENYCKPIRVKKLTWFGHFYFSIESVNGNGEICGKRYKNEKYYDPYICKPNETFYLFGNENTLKSEEETVISESKDIMSRKDNSLKYVPGETKLYVVKQGKTVREATFLRFDQKKGKPVIYVDISGERSFYYTDSGYVFSNSRDATDYVFKQNKYVIKNKNSKQILKAFGKLPTSISPLSDYKEEDKSELSYSKRVNKTLEEQLEGPRSDIAAAKSRRINANMEYREAAIAARADKAPLDDFSGISYELSVESAVSDINDAEKEISIIEGMKRCPYFGRVDCGPNISNTHTAYIGESDIDDLVIDWRNPEIGNAFYLSSTMKMSNDIVIALKRIIEIEDSKYKRFSDEINLYGEKSDIEFQDETLGNDDEKINCDDILTRLLKQSREDKRTHDIIRTMAEKQYEIVTYDFEKNFFVNGCAGSGKTMIMYHRLSYIAYNYKFEDSQTFKPESVYVITPSFYFEMLNKELLQKLKLDKINNKLLYELVDELISIHCTERGVDPYIEIFFEDYAHTEIQFSAGELVKLDKAFYSKVEMTYNNKYLMSAYNVWLTEYINSLLLKFGFNEINFDNVLNGESLSNVLNTYNYYKNPLFSVKKAEGEVKYYQSNAITGTGYENIVESLDNLDHDSALYIKRLRRFKKYRFLLKQCASSRTKRDTFGYISTDIKDFWELFDRVEMFERMLVLIYVEKYIDFVFDDSIVAESDFLLRCKFIKDRFYPQLPAQFEHLFILESLNIKFSSAVTGKTFVFVDEFQNYSLFELKCLKDSFEHPIFNMYGDFDQHISGEGITNQSQLSGLLESEYFDLNYNYRNAKEITEYINEVLDKNMESIGISGSAQNVSLSSCEIYLNNRTAIILKDIASYKDYLKNLSKTCDVNVVSKSKSILFDKINVIELKDCKGLEFDTVYVLDAGMTVNEKYVAYTRALDSLIVVRND